MPKAKRPSEATETAQNAPENETENSTLEVTEAETGRKAEARVAKTATTYTVDEFARGAKAFFGDPINADLVRAAFFVAGITEATKEDAKKLVEEFAYKEVSE